MTRRFRLRLVPGIALLVAVASSAGLIAAGFLVPAYEEATSSSESPVIAHTSSTLVAENGSWVILLLSIPLLATVVVAMALLGSAHPAALVIAWSVTGAVVLLNLLAMLTIGVFVVPITIALVVACADTTAKRKTTRPVVREAS